MVEGPRVDAGGGCRPKGRDRRPRPPSKGSGEWRARAGREASPPLAGCGWTSGGPGRRHANALQTPGELAIRPPLEGVLT